ncbi:DUF484 family protein [Thiofilum flexile]|uniref:DUF484 family protein n=1 Tax=Thiofilum flexile TaxID=125627 RepID=UPI000381D4DC|nr:DUF484 family protein [Thiofilum flexile]
MEPQQVVEFLQQHPDFFTEHEMLLEQLVIPQPSTGNVVSLLERLVQRQRERQQQLEQQLETLMNAARGSERMVGGLHVLATELLGCHDLEQVVQVCNRIIKQEFKAHSVVFRLIGEGTAKAEGLNFISPEDRALKQLSHLFTKRQPVCGRLRPKQQEFLFGAQGSVIKSAVLIPLYSQYELGVLALGSDDEGRYYPGMGTLFINQLGALVSSALTRYITPLSKGSVESTGH